MLIAFTLHGTVVGLLACGLEGRAKIGVLLLRVMPLGRVVDAPGGIARC